MPLMTKLKEMIPWKHKPVETHEVLSLRDDINELFDRVLMSPFETAWSPWSGQGLEMDETEKDVIARVAVPGLDPKRLTVDIRNGMLHVGYEHQEEWRDNGDRGRRRYAAFHRTVALPEGVDSSKAEAMCKHGLLTVRIPWRQEIKDGSRRISISIE